MKQRHTTCNWFATFSFHFLGESSPFHKFSKLGDVFRKKHWVVNKLFVTLIAEYDRLSFVAPWADGKHAIGLCASTVG